MDLQISLAKLFFNVFSKNTFQKVKNILIKDSLFELKWIRLENPHDEIRLHPSETRRSLNWVTPQF